MGALRPPNGPRACASSPTKFSDYPGILTSSVAVMYQDETKYFVSSEGTRLRHGRGFARVVVSAQAKAMDGTDLATGETFEATDPEDLPRDEVIAAAVERVAKDLKALLMAPEAEPFAGPAIFSGRAAGVFFHEIFGHRVEGHRQKDEAEGQTFTKSVGAKVLPDFLSVVFDPTRKKVGNIELNGSYSFDDEGVAARPVTVVENGVLKAFLMSRSPIQGFDHSNGHGRRQPGLEVVSRQSNLFVESSHAVPEARLREMLVEEIKRQNKPYGLYFQDITGGFTTTGAAGSAGLQSDPDRGVQGLSGRAAGRTDSRRGHRRHAAGQLREDSGHVGPAAGLQRLLRRGIGQRAGFGRFAGAPGVGNRDREEEQVAGPAAAAALPDGGAVNGETRERGDAASARLVALGARSRVAGCSVRAIAQGATTPCCCAPCAMS